MATSSPVKKAVIAVAGSGTRFLPATKSQPKEMLPIVDKPIIQYVVEEMVCSGIQEIIFITRGDKRALEDHFDRSLVLEHELQKKGKHEAHRMICAIPDMAHFTFVRQKGHYGTGAALLSAAPLLHDEPFVFAYGDDLVLSKNPFTRKLIKNFSAHGHSVLGVQDVPRADVSKYGIVELKTAKGSPKLIKDIVEKPRREETPSTLATFGRMILTPEVLEKLKKTPCAKDGELYVTDAIRAYVKKGGHVAVQEVGDGMWVTTGDPLNYLKAMTAYTLDRDDDVGNGFREHLKTLLF